MVNWIRQLYTNSRTQKEMEKLMHIGMIIAKIGRDKIT